MSESEFLNRGKKNLGNGYSHPADAQASSTFNQLYPHFLVGTHGLSFKFKLYIEHLEINQLGDEEKGDNKSLDPE